MATRYLKDANGFRYVWTPELAKLKELEEVEHDAGDSVVVAPPPPPADDLPPEFDE